MKKLPAVLVLFAACFAQAETAWIRGDSVSWVRPSTIVTDSGLVFHEPDDALLVAAGFTAVEVPDCAPANRVVTFDPPGIRCKTADELSAEAQAAQVQAAQVQAALLAEIAPVASMMKYALIAQFGTNVFATVPTVQQVAAHFCGKRMNGTLTALDAADWDILNDGYAFIDEKLPGGVMNIPWESIP